MMFSKFKKGRLSFVTTEKVTFIGRFLLWALFSMSLMGLANATTPGADPMSCLLVSEGGTVPASNLYTVNSTADTASNNKCGDADCTLREAMSEANNDSGPSIIRFADYLPVNVDGVAVFMVGSDEGLTLPVAFEPVCIDAQNPVLGWVGATETVKATIVVQLDHAMTTAFDETDFPTSAPIPRFQFWVGGIALLADDSTVKGFSIINADAGILIGEPAFTKLDDEGVETDNRDPNFPVRHVSIMGNHLGVDAAGDSTDTRNRAAISHWNTTFLKVGGCTYVTIAGKTVCKRNAERNVIANNFFDTNDTDKLHVLGNLFGRDAADTMNIGGSAILNIASIYRSEGGHRIEGNRFFGGGVGIQFIGASSATGLLHGARDSLVINNHFEDQSAFGIELLGNHDNIEIIDNTFINIGHTRETDATNISFRPGAGAITILGDADGNIIRSNTISQSLTGIVLANGADNTLIEDNEIFDNRARGIWLGSNLNDWFGANGVQQNAFAIPVGGPSNTVIVRNKIHDNGGTGIMVGSDHDAFMTAICEEDPSVAPFLLCSLDGGLNGVTQQPNVDFLDDFGTGVIHSFPNVFFDVETVWNGLVYDDNLDGSARTTIIENEIYNNGLLGIDNTAASEDYIFGDDLFAVVPVEDGVTANDFQDGDDGASGLQNYPVLAWAKEWQGLIRVHGHLNSEPNSKYRIDFYANDSVDPSGHSEGQRHLGLIELETNNGGNTTQSGNSDFKLEFDMDLVGDGDFVTATATRVDDDSAVDDFNRYGDTSEFSKAVRVSLRGQMR